MISSCVRCGAPSAAFMTFSYADRLVHVEDLGSRGDIPGYVLCTAHADRLSPPVGWTLTDRRNVRALFADLDEGVA
ncbi:MAG: DUF3499 family protein [Acidimicrobiia bacterium]|jgi:hypothetical protein